MREERRDAALAFRSEGEELHYLADAVRDLLGLGRFYTAPSAVEDRGRTRDEVREILRFDLESRPWRRRWG